MLHRNLDFQALVEQHRDQRSSRLVASRCLKTCFPHLVLCPQLPVVCITTSSNHLLLLPVLAVLGTGWNQLMVLIRGSSGTYGPTVAEVREREASSLTRHKGQLSLARTWQRLLAGHLRSGSAQPQLGRHPVTAGKPHDLFQPSLSINLAPLCPRAARLQASPHEKERGLDPLQTTRGNKGFGALSRNPCGLPSGHSFFLFLP